MGKRQFINFGQKIYSFMVSSKQFYENFAQRPDIASKIQGSVIDNIRMAGEQFFQHGSRLIHFGVQEARKLVIYFNFQLFLFSFENHDVIQDKMGDEMPDLMKALKNRCYSVKEAKGHPVVFKETGS